MFRLLLLTIVVGVLLAMFSVTPQHPLVADSRDGMQQSSTPKQLQMDVPPVMCGPTASQLQTVHACEARTLNNVAATGHRAAHPILPTSYALRDSVQASTVLRI